MYVQLGRANISHNARERVQCDVQIKELKELRELKKLKEFRR